MPNFYCEYCGTRYDNVRTLTSNRCTRHPDGSNKGCHKLYEGSEKSQYTCKYCGLRYDTLRTLTANGCTRHPNGANKGKLAPAL